MSTIHLTPDTIEVRFTTSEKIAGLVRDQSIPRSSVVDARVVDDGLSATSGIRAPGLGLPRRRKVGTWRRPGVRQLVSARRGEPALRITLRNHRYDELVLGTSSAAELANELRRAPH